MKKFKILTNYLYKKTILFDYARYTDLWFEDIVQVENTGFIVKDENNKFGFVDVVFGNIECKYDFFKQTKKGVYFFEKTDENTNSKLVQKFGKNVYGKLSKIVAKVKFSQRQVENLSNFKKHEKVVCFKNSLYFNVNEINSKSKIDIKNKDYKTVIFQKDDKYYAYNFDHTFDDKNITEINEKFIPKKEGEQNEK